MSKENKLIPELRFPEFENDGIWADKTLEYVAYSESSSLALNKIELKEKGHPVYGADSIVGYIDEYQQDEKYISIVKDGSGVGRLNLCQAKSSILGTLNCIKSKDSNKFNLDWIYYQMNTIDFNTYKKGSGIPHIYFSDYKSEPIGVPQPQEQKKIAFCLSSLDELISAHNDKLESLKDHKKGLMQNLFPQEGQNVPNYRFPEFEKDGEWETVPLEKYVNVIDGDRGKNYPKSHEFSNDGYCVFLSAANVTKNGFAFNEIQFISKEKDELLRKGKLKRKDIVLTTRGSLGYFAFYNLAVPFNHLRINSGMVILRVKEKVKPEYFYTYCGSDIIKKTIENISYGNAVQQLTVAGIKRFPLLFPNKELEQQKISSCLSALDELITAQSEKIEQLQQHKKGLMQGLFPKIDK